MVIIDSCQGPCTERLFASRYLELSSFYFFLMPFHQSVKIRSASNERSVIGVFDRKKRN
jgi:hypothetical protein